LIDKNKLKSKTIVDTSVVVKSLKENDNYKSIQQIIQQAIEEEFPNKKSYYKIKNYRSYESQ